MEAFLLGLSSGSYCAVACAPVALPFLFAREPVAMPYSHHAALLALFLLGRLLAYLAVGAALGSIGAYAAKYVEPGFSRALARAAYALTGAFMVAWGLTEGFPTARACMTARRVWKPGMSAFVFGALTGASICPPFFAAAARVFSGSSALAGALYFLFFFLGTSLWLLPLLGVPALARRSSLLRFIARSTMIMLGVYFLLVIGLLGAV